MFPKKDLKAIKSADIDIISIEKLPALEQNSQQNEQSYTYDGRGRLIHQRNKFFRNSIHARDNSIYYKCFEARNKKNPCKASLKTIGKVLVKVNDTHCHEPTLK